MVQIFFFSIMVFSLSVSDVFSCQGGGGQFMPPNMQQNGMGGYGSPGGGGCPYQQQQILPYGRGMVPNMNSGPAMMGPGFPGAYSGQFPQGPGVAGQYPGFAGQSSAGYGLGQPPSNDVRCFKVLPNGEMVPIDPSAAADQLALNKADEEKRIAEEGQKCMAKAEAARITLQANEDADIIKKAAAQRAADVVTAAQKSDAGGTALATDATVAPAADVVAAATNPNVTKEGVQIITVP